MEKKWDGKTKGSLAGYNFFVFCVRVFGIRFAYFFCIWVSAWFVLFSPKQRNALLRFYRKGFGFSTGKALRLASSNFYIFGQTLIDRVALSTPRRSFYTYEFNNEKVLREMNTAQKGGILLSGHVGNWENAGNLIHERITGTVNIVMLDAEVQKIKAFLENKTGGPSYQLIPVKDDLSHLILIYAALGRNEFVAIHADRSQDGGKTIELPFLAGTVKFPRGPFILAHMFKAPVTFVYAVKASAKHYVLSATDPIEQTESEEAVARAYVSHLEGMVRSYPNQWFNFFDYYAD